MQCVLYKAANNTEKVDCDMLTAYIPNLILYATEFWDPKYDRQISLRNLVFDVRHVAI